ncbi:MAG: MerR family DNA-binding transcriptional regulator, partial [Candidatus Levyibacteriota bacterium]
MKDELLTIKEAAQFFGVSTRTLIRWEEKGVLKPMRTIGNQRRYSKTHLANLFKNPEIQKPSPLIAQPVPQLHQKTLEKITPQKEPLAIRALVGGSLVGVLVLGLFVLGLLLNPQLTNWLGAPEKTKELSQTQVLGASDRTPAYLLRVNVPAIFGKKVTMLDAVEIKNQLQVDKVANLYGGIKTNNKNIDAGKGKIIASNIIYSLLAGSNISISGNPQQPTISALTTGTSGITSLQGQTGALNFTTGSGISLNGLEISNTGVTSFQGQTGTVTLSGGSGIAVSGSAISNSDPGSAQSIFKTITAGGTNILAGSNNDQLTFAAGSGITLTGDANNKVITIAGTSSGGLSGLTTNGVLYATSTTNAVTTFPGTTGTVLHGITGGAPLFSAVDLTADITNILDIGHGGTGVIATPTNGKLLIGNGSGYTLGTVTAGSGIDISNGSGTISVTNNGVLSLAGTANQVSVTGSTGAIILSLPQTIDQTASPTFTSLNLTSNSGELVLGSGNTGTLSLGGLTGNRTYLLPDYAGVTATVCLSTGNCIGSGGGGVGGSGTTNFLAKFTPDSNHIGNSLLYDDGTSVGVNTASPVGLFDVNGAVVGKALAVFNYTGTDQNILTASASGTTRLALDASGNLNIIGGAYETGGTPRLDTNGNLLNIGTISSTYLSASSNIVNLAASTALQFNGTTVIDASRVLNNIANVATSLTPNAANTYDLGTGTGNQFNNIYANAIFQNGQQVCDSAGNHCPASNGSWTQADPYLYAAQTRFQVGLGTTTPANISSELYVTRTLSDGALGKALAIFNQTESQDLLTASASGVTKFTVNNAGNVTAVGTLAG